MHPSDTANELRRQRTGMQRAIDRNRQRHQARRILHDVRLQFFDYEDAGKADKALRVMDKLRKRLR